MHRRFFIGAAALIAAAALQAPAPANAADNKPNIVVIMGDDIGWSGIGPGMTDCIPGVWTD